MDVNVGDRVSWATPQGRTRGKVVARKVATFQLDGQRFTASNAEPMVVVQSESSGKKAAHKPDALRKLKS